MKITVIGAGNSGLAMAAHLHQSGNHVSLWNRSKTTISKLMDTATIYCDGVIEGAYKINLVTDDLELALDRTDLILITTPANAHKELAERIAKTLKRDTTIVLNPGRTYGAFEFLSIFEKFNQDVKPTIAETQTIIYTCRKTGEDRVNVLALKSGVLISTFDASMNKVIISRLPAVLHQYFIPARSMIETSFGNVGMILHCAPLLLNTGWVEAEKSNFKYYYDGISPSIAGLLEKIDDERVLVSEKLGFKVETTIDWLRRTYQVHGDNLYDCIHNNIAYKTIDAPSSLMHRYIFEDVPCGLVPLEGAGKSMGLNMKYTGLVIDIANALLNVDFREVGRHSHFFLAKQKN